MSKELEAEKAKAVLNENAKIIDELSAYSLVVDTVFYNIPPEIKKALLDERLKRLRNEIKAAKALNEGDLK
jgi:hypothetical protein